MSGSVQAGVQRHFASVRAEARTELLAALDSQRYFSLLDELGTLLTQPPLTSKAAKPCAKVLPSVARSRDRGGQ